MSAKPIAVSVVLWLSAPLALAADDPPEPLPSFLKVGDSYSFHLALAVGSERPPPLRCKILRLGPGEWMYIQDVATESKPPSDSLPQTEVAPRERWLNFSSVGAVTLEGSPSEGPVSAAPNEALPFLKPGGRYYFGAGRSRLPYVAEVREIAGNGWFRAQEYAPAGDPITHPRPQWWVNSAVLSSIWEAETQQPLDQETAPGGEPSPERSAPASQPGGDSARISAPGIPASLPRAKLEYRVVASGNDAADLSHKVNGLIAEGWRPQGGVSISLGDFNGGPPRMFAQAMVRGSVGPDSDR